MPVCLTFKKIWNGEERLINQPQLLEKGSFDCMENEKLGVWGRIW